MKLEPWEEVGVILKDQWRKNRKGHVVLRDFPPWSKAIIAYLQGDHAALAEYLISRPLSHAQQAELAWALGERASKKIGRPKSLDQMNREAWAEMALFFYENWKEKNAERGINDWGHREAMKFQSCELIIELQALTNVEASALIELLERPVSRRK